VIVPRSLAFHIGTSSHKPRRPSSRNRRYLFICSDVPKRQKTLSDLAIRGSARTSGSGASCRLHADVWGALGPSRYPPAVHATELPLACRRRPLPFRRPAEVSAKSEVDTSSPSSPMPHHRLANGSVRGTLHRAFTFLAAVSRCAGERGAIRFQPHADHRSSQRCRDQRQGNPKRRAQYGTRVEAIIQPARVGNQPGDRRTQGNPRLLNRSDGRGQRCSPRRSSRRSLRVAEQTPTRRLSQLPSIRSAGSRP